MNNFWLVYSPQGGAPHVRHESRAEATREAERLACQHLGREFFVLEPVSKTITEANIKTETFAGGYK